jgi:hypothetical protein
MDDVEWDGGTTAKTVAKKRNSGSSSWGGLIREPFPSRGVPRRKTLDIAKEINARGSMLATRRAKKQRGMLWPSVVSKLELAHADVKAMNKVYDFGPK